MNEFRSGASVSRQVPVPSGIRNVAFTVLPEIVPVYVSGPLTSVPENVLPLWEKEKTSEPLAVQSPDQGPPGQRARPGGGGGGATGVSRGSFPPLW